jgi:thymidylate synthase (FAD)
MTKQEDVIGNKNYIPVLDKGFVGLVSVMGDDSSIVQAARVSYGKGTKTVSEDRALIRYLMRHRHTSPFEMVEFKFHIKLPIFVMRQHIRHRTANVNEYSGRYSEMSNEFYVPENFKTQSNSNKQGSEEPISRDNNIACQNSLINQYEACFETYETFLQNGISRELARIVLPVSNYTECYWKIDLKNLLHYFSLRKDSHAQYEIRAFADAMYELIKPYVPITLEAFEEYMFFSFTISRTEFGFIRKLFENYETCPISEKDMKESGMTQREIAEFKNNFFPGR